ncbi:MAG: gamma-glutamyl-phosphate reductase, partial [Crocosphaera sp.]
MVATPHQSLSLTEIAQDTREASQRLGVLSTEDRNQAIEAIAQTLETASDEIIQANETDCKAAEKDGISKPLYNRLKLGESKLKA